MKRQIYLICSTVLLVFATAALPSIAAAGPPAVAAPNSPVAKAYAAMLENYAKPAAQRRTNDEIFDAVGLSSTSDILKQGNPDPAWMLIWSDDFSHNVIAGYVRIAARNRAWQKQCFAEYTSFRAAWRQLEGEFRPRFEEIRKEPNFYLQNGRLFQLLAELITRAGEQKLVPPDTYAKRFGTNPMAWVGLRAEILAALFTLHTETGRGYRLKHKFEPLLADVDGYRAFGRPWTADETFERDVFCGWGMLRGTHALAPLGQGDWNAPVAWPVAHDQMDVMQARLKKLSAPIARQLEFVNDDVPPFAFGDENKPQFLRASGWTVDKVERIGSTTVLRVSEKAEGPWRHSCKRTGRIAAIDANGVVIYEENCKHGTQTTTRRADATFADLPAEVAINKGDIITFTADVTTRKESTKKKGKSLLREGAYKMTGRHMENVERGKQAVYEF